MEIKHISLSKGSQPKFLGHRLILLAKKLFVLHTPQPFQLSLPPPLKDFPWQTVLFLPHTCSETLSRSVQGFLMPYSVFYSPGWMSDSPAERQHLLQQCSLLQAQRLQWATMVKMQTLTEFSPSLPKIQHGNNTRDPRNTPITLPVSPEYHSPEYRHNSEGWSRRMMMSVVTSHAPPRFAPGSNKLGWEIPRDL